MTDVWAPGPEVDQLYPHLCASRMSCETSPLSVTSVMPYVSTWHETTPSGSRHGGADETWYQT